MKNHHTSLAVKIYCRFLCLSAGHVALGTTVARDLVGLEGLAIYLGIKTSLRGLCTVGLTVGSG